MNAFTNTIMALISAFTLTLTTTSAALAQPAAAPATKPAAKPAAAPAHTYSEHDVALGKKLSDTINAGAREQKCLLVTVVASQESYSRDLALFSRSDLAAGALVQAEMVMNEAGAISGIIGLNAQVELLEDNSVDVFGKRVYVSYAAKAAGKGVDQFTSAAAKAGFLVSSSTVACNSTARPADLTQVAEKHLKDLREAAKRKAEIASR